MSATMSKVDPWKNTDPPDMSVVICGDSLQVTWSDVDHVHCGLFNFGESCYMNATVQALLHLPPFIHLVRTLSGQHRRGGKSSCDCVVCAFNTTFSEMKATTSILSHQSLADKLPVINKKLKLNKQEDAQEFLISVFDRIVHEEVVRHSEKQSLSYCAKLTTGIDSLFGFWLETTSVCLGCGASHTTYSSHRHLLIPTSGKTVQKGIDAVMSNTETVQGYACPACHVKQTCSKSLQFHTYPKTLVVTVDRFVNSENDSKDGTPLVMNRKISVGTATYSFRSSVIHHGPVKTAGHYTCTAVCPDDSCVELNDCEVKPHSNSAQAYATLIGSYLIFYQLESNMVLKVVKRSRIPTPTKLSPASKKWKSPFEKKLSGGILQHLSPKKPGKTLTFGKSILKQCASASELLAEPLQSDNSDQYHKPTNSRLPKQVHKSNEQNLRAALPPVPSLKIQISHRTQPKDTLSQSSHEYAIVPIGEETSQDSSSIEEGTNKNMTVSCSPCAAVPSLKIHRSQRLHPKDTSSQSSHEGTIEVLNRSSSDIFADDFVDELPAAQSFTFGSPNVSVQRPEVPHYNEGDIVLSESDVPGAKLPNPTVEENVVRDLKRWLYCHGQNVRGNKTALIARVVECMNRAEPPLVRRDADKGVWIRRKLDRLRMAYSIQCSQINFPDCGFGTFPSRDIPQSFNFGSIFHYLLESRPMLQCSSSSSDESADEALEIVHIVQMKDPFTDPKCKEMLRVKVLRRGLQYVKSGWVKGLQDCSDGRYYYVKAHVRASMEPEAYWVYITISTITGGVCQATCGYPCPATANGRCSHVSAALLQILAHIHLNGYG
ncbi:ubiquitin carboxyl-terminal hydrolase 36-like [Thrips palmi]|uniref:ubiquitinyl hydrolase 1 n=1 Tax=Thrips palmi TaxID=161013 RepID=A0A6P8Y9F5_THRPL|nr:ubiquitin carboxyl-terminal hydrolase 36-like [Thrips palmi]